MATCKKGDQVMDWLKNARSLLELGNTSPKKANQQMYLKWALHSVVNHLEALSSTNQDRPTSEAIEMLVSRSKEGLATYGVTLDRNDLMPAEWATHLAEELADGLKYVLKLREALSSTGVETSEPSSAPTTGPAKKPYKLPSASLPSTYELIQLVITDYFRSMQFMPARLEGNWIDSSTLQLTLRWPTPSGQTKAGDRGPAAHEPGESGWCLTCGAPSH
jgi:hypothetical protein